MVETDEKGGHDNGWMSDVYLDIAPTIDDIIGVTPAKEWEEKSLVSEVNI